MKSYVKLEKIFSRLHSLDHATSILGWDESVMMPSHSGEARAQVLAELKVLRHETLLAPELNSILETCDHEHAHLTAWQRANLREIQRAVRNANAVKKDLVEALSLATSKCEQAWRSLRNENNWKDFLPLFTHVVELTREEANQRADSSGLNPYDSLLDQFNPGLNSNQITSIFDKVKKFLPSLIEQVIEKQKSIKVIQPSHDFPVPNQKSLGMEVMQLLGFDFKHGRLDVSHHPFCGGVPQDIRITTRYNLSNFIESLMGVIHETGHACYEQNLPKEWIAQPVGLARGMHIHESQSLFFEIYIGRSFEFLQLIHPLIIKNLASDPKNPYWQVSNIYQQINKVEKSLIRVNADEVTYPAHIIMRYEIERDLILQKIEPKDIPDLWNSKMSEYLNLNTEGNYQNGCMQDMHWPAGAFGYFPSYSLGAMTAAQIYHAIHKIRPNLNDEIRAGDFSFISNWLRGHIWSQGSFSSTNDLLINSTGETLNPEYFREHIEQKYLRQLNELPPVLAH